MPTWAVSHSPSAGEALVPSEKPFEGLCVSGARSVNEAERGFDITGRPRGACGGSSVSGTAIVGHTDADREEAVPILLQPPLLVRSPTQDRL